MTDSFDATPAPTAVIDAPAVTKPAPGPKRRGLIGLVTFIVLQVLGGTIVYFAARALGFHKGPNLDDQSPVPFLVTALLLVTQGLVSNGIPIRFIEHRSFRTLGFRLQPSIVRDIALGLFAGALTPAIVVVCFLFAGAATIHLVPVNLLAVTVPMIIGMTLISSSEEILLRGYFMQAVGAMGGPITASVVSGLVFGLMHAGNPGANPMGLIITGVNGILLAYMMVRMGSLWLACAYHAGWNLIAALGFGLRDSGMLSPGAIASTELHGSTFWSGGSYGFEASIVAFVVEWFVLFALLKWGPRLVFDAEAQPYFAMTKRPTVIPSADSTR